jgi:hypothetical protein
MSGVAFIQAPPRPLEKLAGYIEYAHGLWEWGGINTGAFIALLKVLVAEARRAAQLTSNAESNAAARRVLAVVHKLRDNWRARVDEELAHEA